MSSLGGLLVYAFKEWQKPKKKKRPVDMGLGHSLLGASFDILSYYREPDLAQREQNRAILEAAEIELCWARREKEYARRKGHVDF